MHGQQNIKSVWKFILDGFCNCNLLVTCTVYLFLSQYFWNIYTCSNKIYRSKTKHNANTEPWTQFILLFRSLCVTSLVQTTGTGLSFCKFVVSNLTSTERCQLYLLLPSMLHENYTSGFATPSPYKVYIFSMKWPLCHIHIDDKNNYFCTFSSRYNTDRCAVLIN